MSAGDSSDTQYADDYARLQIGYTSDWAAVRASYRHLVNRWHPDKFPANSREKHHAQQQFIDLTKSYTLLRNYYRRTGQLPLQKTRARTESTRGGRSCHLGAGSADNDARQRKSGKTVNTLFPGTNTIRRSRQGNGEPGSIRWWIICAALLILATAAILLFDDIRTTRATVEQAREALKHAPASEFALDSSEIRKVKRSEALLKQPGL